MFYYIQKKKHPLGPSHRKSLSDPLPLFKIRVLLKITHQIAWAQTEGIPSAEAFRPSPRWRGPPPQFHPGVGSEYSSQDSGLDNKKRVLDLPPFPLALSISFISSDHFSNSILKSL